VNNFFSWDYIGMKMSNPWDLERNWGWTFGNVSLSGRASWWIVLV